MKIKKLGRCSICQKDNIRVLDHHLSYGFLSPEETIEVCHFCHGQIHNGSLPDYLPVPLETAYYRFDFEAIPKLKRKYKRQQNKIQKRQDKNFFSKFLLAAANFFKKTVLDFKKIIR